MAAPVIPAIWIALEKAGEAVVGLALGAGLYKGGEALYNEMSKAEEGAKEKAEKGSVADACSTCPPPECKELAEEIRATRDELVKRYDEMRIDKFDLYANHLLESNPLILNGRKIGSWNGHLRQYSQKQKGLREAIHSSLNKGCSQGDLPQDKWKWATEPAPSQPR